MQSFGTNYLLPVDVALSDAADLDLRAVEANSVLLQMHSAKNKTNIVILDACRNNPFTALTDITDNGLAEMKAPTGTFLALATQPGGVAMDGIGNNSLLTEALSQQMTTPGLPIEQVFKRVRNDVLETTQGRQTPWDTSSLTSDFAFVAEEQKSSEYLAALSLWESVKAKHDAVQIMLFLRAYPSSEFAPEAFVLLEEVMAEEISGRQAAATPEPKAPEPAPAPTASDTAADEKLMYDMALADKSAIGLKTYIEAYPDGIYARRAQDQIAALEPAAAAPAPAPKLVELEPMPAPNPSAEKSAVPDETLLTTLNTPLTTGDERVRGATIAELIKDSPSFPPIEGLPNELWKDQTCSNCHQ